MNLDFVGLCSLVEKYLGWDADGMIPHLVGLAEHRLQREMRLRVMERRGTNTTIPKKEGIALPNKRIPGDWDVYMEMREVGLRTNRPVNLEYITPDWYTDKSAVSGVPQFYTIIGREILFAPIPDNEYTILLAYYAQIPPLSAEQPTNDVLLTYPDLYLYATLVESAAYSRSAVPAQEWVSMYTAAKADAQSMDTKARYGKQIAAKPPRRL